MTPFAEFTVFPWWGALIANTILAVGLALLTKPIAVVIDALVGWDFYEGWYLVLLTLFCAVFLFIFKPLALPYLPFIVLPLVMFANMFLDTRSVWGILNGIHLKPAAWVAIVTAWAMVAITFMGGMEMMVYFFPIPSQEWLEACTAPDGSPLACTWGHPEVHFSVALAMATIAGIPAFGLTYWLITKARRNAETY